MPLESHSTHGFSGRGNQKGWFCGLGAIAALTLDRKDMLFGSGAGVFLAELSKPATATILVIVVLAAIGVYEFTRQRLTRYRAGEMARILKDAENSYGRGMAGLQDMAGVVTGMSQSPKTFAHRGVGLLDAYAGAAMSFKNMLRNIRTMSRDRALRHMTRELLTLQGQETMFQRFQTEVLRVASTQAVAEKVLPPVPTRNYRVTFTILRHNIPKKLWPMIDEILASGVQVKVLDADQLNIKEEAHRKWDDVPVTFANGGQAIFSRQYLERAAALKMTIHSPGRKPKIFDYTVAHEKTVKPKGLASLFKSSGNKAGMFFLVGGGVDSRHWI